MPDTRSRPAPPHSTGQPPADPLTATIARLERVTDILARNADLGVWDVRDGLVGRIMLDDLRDLTQDCCRRTALAAVNLAGAEEIVRTVEQSFGPDPGASVGEP